MTSQTKIDASDFYVDFEEVMRRVCLSRSAIYRRLNAGTFPQPRKIGDWPQAPVRWLNSEITAWMQGHVQIATRRQADEV